jgi:ferritin-like metal-binding protein YciE
VECCAPAALIATLKNREGIAMPKAQGLQQLLVQELQDLYDAEKQLVKALPKIAKACSGEELASAFRDHLEVTKGQVGRLEQIFESMGMRARSKPCKGMKGLVEEGQEHIQELDEPALLDVALNGAGRRVEHYEMAGYESARVIAAQLGMRDAAQLLQETLREEMAADKLLAQLAKRGVKEAMSAGMEEEEEASTRRGRGRTAQARQSGGRQRSARAQSSSHAGRSAAPMTDHEEIRRWAEQRGASPACVRGTGGRADTGMIRLDFPGYSGQESLQPISWDDWFEKFDEKNLALLVRGDNFNKLVSRSSGSSGRRRPSARAAG